MIRKNILRNSRKAFAFTFLAFFLSVVIFSFVAMNMDKVDFTKDNEFKDARISYIDDEIKYFKNSYVESIVSYSLLSSLGSLTNYSRVDANYEKYNDNYSKFQSYVVEGMIQGSFDSDVQSDLINKTVLYFMQKFSDNFYDAYKGNFTFRILNIYLFEDKPYYVSAQMFVEYNITTLDNISNWNFLDEFVVSVPIDSLYDPEFVLLDDLDVKIRSSERYLSENNWTIDMLKEVLDENYSLVFYEPTYRYTLGGSYFSRFMNVSVNSYQDVLGFWSFDYDEESLGVVDSSMYSGLSNHYGNSRLLMSFDSSTISGSNVLDSSAYENNGTIINSADCTVLGIRYEGCEFNGVDEYIKIDDSFYDLNETGSISVWFNAKDCVGQISGLCSIFDIRGTGNGGAALFLQNDSFLRFQYGNGTNVSQLVSVDNVSLDEWHNVVIIWSDVGTSLFIDGVRNNVNYFIPNISDVRLNTYIGSHLGIQRFFNGAIDSLAVYSKLLTNEEISRIYTSKGAESIDYKDSLHGQGVEFDGVDDYVSVDVSSVKNVGDYSLELWIKPYLNSSGLSMRQGVFLLGNDMGDSFRFFLNGMDKLEYDILPGEIGNLVSDFSLDEWQHFVITYDGSDLKLYKNSKLEDLATIGAVPMGNLDSLELSWKAVDKKFSGIIDEVKIYNRTLSDEEIQRNYYNYKEFGKGCCNYLTLINPNTMGFNNAIYDGNHSYSSKYFYDKFKRGISLPEVALFNITNVTSNDVSKDYYNFLMDKCIADAYSIFDYSDEYISVDFVNIDTFEEGTNDCSELIRLGYY